MNIRINRTYVIEYYRVYKNEGKFYHKFYTTNFFIAYASMFYHSIMNRYSDDKICIRIIGSY